MKTIHICFLFLWCFTFYALTPIPIISNMSPTKIKITIGNKIFTATLENNKTAVAFKSSLPLTIKMIELNGNEKYGELSKTLPTLSKIPGKIEVGDLMLYGNQTLVIFYKSFATSYAYTTIGRIDDIEGLTTALGLRDVTITID
jgi:hypothetical protein